MKQMFKSKYFYLAIALFSFLYVLVRAIYVGITYDEAWTISTFVPMKPIAILINPECDANNHILNTFLIKFFYHFGLNSIFFARLPNVLSFLVYLFFAYKISTGFLSARSGLVVFLLLVLNPYLLDFFSLARGYGISMACLAASVYYLFVLFREQSKSAYTFLSVGWALLGVLANLSMLNYYLALICVIGLFSLIMFRKEVLKIFLVILAMSGLLALILWKPTSMMMKTGHLYYGGNTGFYQDTLVSLAKYTMYSPEVSGIILISLNVFLALFVISVLLSFRKDQAPGNLRNVMLAVFLLSAGSVVLQHFLFNNLYLIDRAALFYYPLAILTLCISIDQIKYRWVSLAVSGVLIAAFGLNFILHCNFYKTATWYFDAHTREILKIINNDGKMKRKVQKVDFSWPFQNSVRYYCRKSDFPYIRIVQDPIHRSALNPGFDYYLYLSRSLEKVGYDPASQRINAVAKDTARIFSNEGVYLFKRLN
jgi:hypothetical protein